MDSARAVSESLDTEVKGDTNINVTSYESLSAMHKTTKASALTHLHNLGQLYRALSSSLEVVDGENLQARVVNLPKQLA